MNSPRLALLLGAATLALVTHVRAQTPPTDAPKTAKPAMGSMVVDWEKLAVTPTKNGERRTLFDGPTATLTNLESHATTLNPGELSHPPHRHPDEELIAVKEGTIEVTINGQSQRAGAGSVFFFASNDLHNMKNVGTTPATYLVFRFVSATTPKPAVAAPAAGAK